MSAAKTSMAAWLESEKNKKLLAENEKIVGDELKKLTALHELGLFSDEELKEKKQKIVKST